jgi:hypothetical protein
MVLAAARAKFFAESNDRERVSKANESNGHPLMASHFIDCKKRRLLRAALTRTHWFASLFSKKSSGFRIVSKYLEGLFGSRHPTMMDILCPPGIHESHLQVRDLIYPDLTDFE